MLARLFRRVVLGLGLAGCLASRLAPSRAEEPAAPARSDPLPEGAIARLGSTRFRHGGMIRCLAISPDGKTVASSADGQTVRIWDVKTGRKVRESERQYGGGALAYSPDGATLAVYGTDPYKPGIYLLNAATASERHFVALRDPVIRFGRLGTVAFSPDGKNVASVKPAGEICLIDPVRAKMTAVLGKHERENVPVLVFSPNGRVLASSAQDATIRLWDVARRKTMFVLRSEDTSTSLLVFSRDGKWLISGGGMQEKPRQDDSPWGNPAIRIWDVATGKQLRVFKDTGVRGGVCSLALAPDGRTLAVSCEYTLRLWDVNTGKVLRSLSGARTPKQAVSKLCFSPDGKFLAGALGNTIGLWNVESGRLLNLDVQESVSAIFCTAFSGDGRMLATGDGNGYLSLWDFRNRWLIRHFRGHDTAVRRLVFSPDDKSLASISQYYDRLRVWNVANGRQRYQFPIEERMDSRPSEVVFSPDGKLLAYGHFFDTRGGSRGIRLLDAATGAMRQNLTIKNVVSDGWFIGIGFSPDGGHLMSATTDGEIHGWKRTAERFVDKGTLGQLPACSAVAYSDRGLLAAEWITGKVLSFRDFETGQPMRGVPEFPLLGQSLKISGDGRYLAAGPPDVVEGKAAVPRDSSLRIIEMVSGQEVLRLRLPPYSGCRATAFAPDGRTLITGMTDSTVLLWDLVPTGKDAAKDGPALWTDLADNDAAKAYRAACRLMAAPADALALLRPRLKPVEGMEEKCIERLIADLDSDAFVVREKATGDLRKLDLLAEPACRKALAARPTLEMRRRLQELLEDIPPWQPSPENLRQVRAIEVLERIATPEARKLLESLADGAAGARLTREAHAAVQRLKARHGDKP